MPEPNDAFSFEKTRRLRGMMILGVFVFHFYGHFPNATIPEMGHLFVGAFFMLSGFGLMESLKNKENYLNGFIGKKIARLLVPVWIAGLIVLVVHLTIYHNYTVFSDHAYLFDIVSGGPTLTSTWFVIELIFLYLFFYLAFKYLKNGPAIFTVFLATAFLMILFSQQGKWWSSSGMMFPIGLLLSCWKNKVESLNPNILLIFTIFFSLILAYLMGVPRETPVLTVVYGNLQCVFAGFLVIISLLIRNTNVSKWLLALLFCNVFYYILQNALSLGPNITTALPLMTLFLFLAGLNFISEITNFIGKISYEFYIIHDTVIIVSVFWFSNMLLCFALSLVVSIILATIIKMISKIFFDEENRNDALPEKNRQRLK